MYCKKCGSKLPDESVFCTQCRARMKASVKSVAAKTAAVKETAVVKETEPEEKPISELGKSKAKKAKISKKVFCFSSLAFVISLLLFFIVGFNIVLAVIFTVSFLMAIFSFIAMCGYIKDIPKDEKTKSQKVLTIVVIVITSLLVLFFSWYRLMGGQEYIMNLIMSKIA